MTLDSRIRELLTKTKVFFVGDAEELRENLSPRSIKWASIAEVVLPFGTTFAYIIANQGDIPRYSDIAIILTTDGAMRLLFPPVIKRYNELWNGYIPNTSFEEMNLLTAPTGILGKAEDAVYIGLMSLYRILHANNGNHTNT